MDVSTKIAIISLAYSHQIVAMCKQVLIALIPNFGRNIGLSNEENSAVYPYVVRDDRVIRAIQSNWKDCR